MIIVWMFLFYRDWIPQFVRDSFWAYVFICCLCLLVDLLTIAYFIS